MILKGTMPTNSPTMMDKTLTKVENHLTIRHLQGFLFPFVVNLIAYSNEDQMKCNSDKSFKQPSGLCYCLISRMFSEADSSYEEIVIYVKLFLFV